MSKVLFLVNHDVVIYNFRLEIVEALIAQGHKVIISSPYGERIEDLKTLGCEYHDIQIDRHGMNPLKEIKLVSVYNKLLNDVKPDIVFSFTIKPNIYGAIACKSRKIPIVCNITGLGTAVENPGMKQKVLTLLYKFAFKGVQKVFFQNIENQLFFKKKKIVFDNYSLLPGSGVNIERFLYEPYPSDIRILFMARLMKEKGIDEFLYAAERIKTKYPSVCFDICGFCEEDYEPIIDDLSRRGIVEYHGMVRNTREYYKMASFVVLPSYHEGMSNTLLESAATGRPIITSNVHGCIETIDDGISGFICNVKDKEDLEKKIEKMILLDIKEREHMGIKGREKMKREFDRKIVVDAYLKEIDRAVKE